MLSWRNCLNKPSVGDCFIDFPAGCTFASGLDVRN
jgi:hypothetical protein